MLHRIIALFNTGSSEGSARNKPEELFPFVLSPPDFRPDMPARIPDWPFALFL